MRGFQELLVSTGSFMKELFILVAVSRRRNRIEGQPWSCRVRGSRSRRTKDFFLTNLSKGCVYVNVLPFIDQEVQNKIFMVKHDQTTTKQETLEFNTH